MVAGTGIRAEVLRVLHKVTAGVPELSPGEAMAVALPSVSKRDFRFMRLAGDEDLALLNALLSVEAACRREAWERLEHLMALCQFAEGTLDERLRGLPMRAFASAALDLYELGWINR
ncbi:MAG TPA: hypothetical protein VF063_10595 [Gaiellaceae bacterium]